MISLDGKLTAFKYVAEVFDGQLNREQLATEYAEADLSGLQFK